ncbi:hypothetical protein BEQ56_11935 [Anaerolineaceae bacterium oral taxon 439]|nr:hypothetical protein BEQ56_11935 [Anaerolineaceae bacterium oral taxon 439]
MKNYRLFVFLCAMLMLLFALTAVTAQSDLEKFMEDFEPDYPTSDKTFLSGMDTTSPYAKPVRQAVTTDDGVVIMLDKVLVTEDDVTVSVLLGVEPRGENWAAPSSFQLGLSMMEVTPHIPYPPDYFEIIHGGVGGGGPILNKIHDDPFVVYDFIRSELMFDDGYVSPKDPMHIKVTILKYEICWDVVVIDDYSEPRCFKENGPWNFEFDTDGAELAAKTKEFEMHETFEIDGKKFSLDRLRFNPFHIILFTSGRGANRGYQEDSIYGLTAFIEADDGTQLRLFERSNPYNGFDRKIVAEALNESLEKTKALKVMFCLNRINGEPPKDYDWESIRFYTCDPAWSTVIDLE